MGLAEIRDTPPVPLTFTNNRMQYDRTSFPHRSLHQMFLLMILLNSSRF
jgi:hypothetical protein